MATKYEEVEVKKHVCRLFCVSWSSIIIGSLVGLGLAFIINLFGLAVGLTAFSTSAAGLKTLAIGGFFAMLIGVMITTFISGWVAGFLGRDANINPNVGLLYGFTVWSIVLLVSILLTSSVGQYVNTQYASFTDRNGALMKITSTAAPEERNNRAATSSSNTLVQVNPNDEKAMKTAGKTLFLVFLFVIVGAIMSSFGGYMGIRRNFYGRRPK